MQYDQFDPLQMTLNELRIQFTSIRVDLKHTQIELQKTSQELTELKNKPTKTPKWKMALGGIMSIMIALNSILINVGTGLLADKPPNTLGYLVLAFAGFVYAVGIFVTIFIVGGRVSE
jgi:hypothetical protein